MWDVAIDRNHMFLVGGSPEGLYVFDLSNRAQAEQIGYVQISGARAVTFADGHVYVGDVNGFIHVIETSDPTLPREKAAALILHEHPTNDPFRIFQLAVLDNVLVAFGRPRSGVVGASDKALVLVDISDPGLLSELGALKFDSSGPWPIDIVVMESSIITIVIRDMVEVDVANATDPSLLRTKSLSGLRNVVGFSLVLRFPYVYVAVPGDNRVLAILVEG